MLGNSALAQTPFAALGGGVVYTRYAQEAATNSDVVVAVAAFTPRVVGSGTATGSSTVGPSIFSASAVASSQATDATTALGGFNASVVSISNGSELVTVDPSVFNADVTASALGTDTILANAVFIAISSGGALGVDTVTRRLLWEIINDSQSSNWVVVKTQP